MPQFMSDIILVPGQGLQLAFPGHYSFGRWPF
jgi:hypothetical protein